MAAHPVGRRSPVAAAHRPSAVDGGPDGLAGVAPAGHRPSILCDVPPPVSIPRALEDAVQGFGDREALVDGEVRLTFAQLREEAHAVARALIGSGLQAG